MCQHSIANIDINKDYDESLGTEEVHYQSFARMAAFFGRVKSICASCESKTLDLTAFIS